MNFPSAGKLSIKTIPFSQSVLFGLMSYGASLPDLFRRAATYLDKLLKGANPADLPVEQPTKLELVLNLRTAKELGLAVSFTPTDFAPLRRGSFASIHSCAQW